MITTIPTAMAGAAAAPAAAEKRKVIRAIPPLKTKGTLIIKEPQCESKVFRSSNEVEIGYGNCLT